MNAYQYKNTLDNSFGLKLIVAGLTELIENEGFSPHEAFRLLDETKKNTFQVLSEIRQEG